MDSLLDEINYPKKLIEIAENNGNRIFTQPPGIKGNFDVRE